MSESLSKKEELFRSYVREWSKKTWLAWWKIDVVFFGFKEYSQIDEIDYPHNSLAICHTKWEYMTAKISVNSEVLEEQDEEDIEYFALHELMHIFLNETREEGYKHEERVATFLARSFISCKERSKNG